MPITEIMDFILIIPTIIAGIVAAIQKVLRSKEVKALEDELDKLRREFKRLIGEDVNTIDKKKK